MSANWRQRSFPRKHLTFVAGMVISVVTLVFLCISYVFVTFRRRTKKTDS